MPGIAAHGIIRTFLTQLVLLMKKMIALISTACIITLSGCVYHPPFQQGNILTPAKVQKIQPGMTVDQVTKILGSPVLQNMYADNHMVYIYTSSPSRKEMVIKKVMIDFVNGQVTNVRTAL